MSRKKLALLLGLALALAAFVALDLGQYLSLDYLKRSRTALGTLATERPLTLAVGFFAVYVAIAALSIPGAGILTLAGGAIFGLGWGLLLVSFASSIGALLAFLAARFVLHDAVQARFGRYLGEFNRGFAKDGALYLFGLRLVPLVPFFAVNLLMGLTPMKAITFYWVTQLGLFAGTAVMVNAGTQLAHIESFWSIFSPSVLGSLALLGIFPLLARRLVALWQRRKA